MWGGTHNHPLSHLLASLSPLIQPLPTDQRRRSPYLPAARRSSPPLLRLSAEPMAALRRPPPGRGTRRSPRPPPCLRHGAGGAGPPLPPLGRLPSQTSPGRMLGAAQRSAPPPRCGDRQGGSSGGARDPPRHTHPNMHTPTAPAPGTRTPVHAHPDA